MICLIYPIQRVFLAQLRKKKKLIRLFNLSNRFSWHTGTPETNKIDSSYHGRPPHHHIGRNVLVYTGKSPYHGTTPNATELMYHHIPGNKRGISHFYVSGQQRTIRDYCIIADFAIMPHMSLNHQHVIITNNRSTSFFCPAVYCYVFPYDIIFSDPGKCFLA